MPPKPKVNRTEIIAAARALLEEGGPSLVTARAVADRLKVSTRPIYSLFNSMDEVLEAIIPDLEAELNAHMAASWTGNGLADRGIGVLIYGRDHPAALEYFLSTRESRGQLTRGSRMHQEFIEALRTSEGVESLEDADLECILTKLEIFTQGLLNAMRVGAATMANDDIIKFTNDIGEALIVHAVMKKNGALPD